MADEFLAERTYQALMGVVQTTAVSRKVLARPPFTFLHKLLVETLSEYDLFSDYQMLFSEMTTKQAKAAFLTRAIAFVTFAMRAQSSQPQISCLLLVSPVQVLAGVAVSDTLQFLLQLCEVCRMSNRDIKDAAAKEVRDKGDAHLYSSGVIFRKGLILIQNVIRSFLRRRVRKTVPRSSGALVHGQEISMTEGTRFLKELADGRIYNGVIRSVQKNIFVLGYEEDAEAQDKVSEIEMKIILEESQRLSAAREGHGLTRNGNMDRSDDISVSDLPDLSESPYPRAAGFFKRVSSPVASQVSRRNLLKRAQSTRASNMGKELVSLPSGDSLLNAEGMKRAEDNQQESSQFIGRFSKDSDWQRSLKKMLAEGRDQSSSGASIGPEVESGNQMEKHRNQPVDTVAGISAHMPSFPKLGIPGMKPIGSLLKRGSGGLIDKKLLSKESTHSSLLPNPSPAPKVTPLQRVNSLSNCQRPGGNGPSIPSASEIVVDTVFTGTYQTTDQRRQEKQALIRDIVMRIDSYMKRKRLRVIDLFRFCDADGNGSISPQEMIDTLSQMEIQLTPDQARDFLEHIDKDGNGSIDVDEFEELVRVARRNEAQREQLKKELHGPRKQLEGKSSQKQSAAMKAKAKQQILDEFKVAIEEDGDGMTVNQLRSLIGRLTLPGVNDTFVSSILDRVVDIAAGSFSSLSPSSQPQSPNSKCFITSHHLAKALDELEWTKKSNRFLDQSWIRQFDSQLERAIREYEML